MAANRYDGDSAPTGESYRDYRRRADAYAGPDPLDAYLGPDPAVEREKTHPEDYALPTDIARDQVRTTNMGARRDTYDRNAWCAGEPRGEPFYGRGRKRNGPNRGLPKHVYPSGDPTHVTCPRCLRRVKAADGCWACAGVPVADLKKVKGD